MAETEALVREALAAAGFGVLTEIDVQATLQEKLSKDTGPYKILGACHPPSVYRALEAWCGVGVLLPCNVVLYRTGDHVPVQAFDPLSMGELVEFPELVSVAREASERLDRAMRAVEDRAA
ncbi:MAG: DUF302 domain-containing protein [Dehalococcoidia bacterium]|nr:DUF302 domain-containing protein [Dehalococcoidia bacterium]